MRSLARAIPIVLALSLAPAFAQAALININTADAALLDTLPGIGPSKAQAIVDYRTQNGPFAAIEAIQNVSGIGPSTFANIAPLITVAATDVAPDTGTATATTSAATAGASEYVPPPSSLSLDIGGDRVATLDTPVAFTAAVKAKGAADPSAVVSWSFGDGSSAEGVKVSKTYRYAGSYAVTAVAIDGDAASRAGLVVTASRASVRIAAVSGDGVTLANDDGARLDLSGWRLSSDSGTFHFPAGTILLPGMTVLIPWAVTNLPESLSLTLGYPDGVIAARYPGAPAQPAAVPGGSQVVQTVESALTTNSSPAHAPEALDAPREIGDTAISRGAAAGADPAASSAPVSAASSAAPGAAGFLRSGWALGLLGVLALAGGAFMIL